MNAHVPWKIGEKMNIDFSVVVRQTDNLCKFSKGCLLTKIIHLYYLQQSFTPKWNIKYNYYRRIEIT